ncbi:unnamed protein product [Withania somnifera]
MVGAGVLGLPYAMAELGWYFDRNCRGPGVAVMSVSWVITLYTPWQIVEMHEMVPGKRFDRYLELGQHAFGKKLGLYIVVPQQLVVEVGLGIVYMVTGGKSFQKIHDLVCNDNCLEIKLAYYIMIFASNSYCIIAWAASIAKGMQPNVDYGYKAENTGEGIFNFLSGFGEVAFAYAGHNVVLEIQATIPSTPEKPSKGPMWKGVVFAYVVVALCYFPAAFIGNSVSDIILITLNKPNWLIVQANAFVIIHIIGCYQLYAIPVFHMVETYLLPCIMWLSVYRPKKWGLSWTTNWICIILGVMLTVLAPIGGLRTITVQAKDYKFFS